ncbi:MAG TPA: hypothetical protein PK619_00340 [bacterium]|nr:hypothetical protein [bacterium]HPN81095.1 hypothetical protein [bacterium]HPW39161.1 hypothetical protein [bacterium]
MKTFISYATVIIIGLLLLSADSIKPFLAFLLICILVLHYRVDFNRKMIRVSWVGTDTKLLALAKKANISEKDIKQIFNEEKQKWGDSNKKSFIKDISSVMDKKVIDDDTDL